MRLRILLNTFRETGRNVRRHPLITFASLTTMTLMLLVLGAFILFSANANRIMDAIGQEPPVEIWMMDDIPQEQTDAIEGELENNEYVLSYNYLTSEEHYENFQEDLGEDSELLNSIDPDTMPNSFVVQLISPEYVDQFIEEINVFPGIDSIDYSEPVTEFLTTWSRRINIISIVAVAILFFVALVIISNMTRMSILARSDEISIMKYIGATSSYIRVPYFLEGAFIGIFGAILGGGILWVSYYNIYANMMGDTSVTSNFALIPTAEIMGPVFLILVVMGALVGSIGSGLSVRKYVNV